MEDKLEEVLKQYPCEVRTRRRTRGAFLLETDQGLRLLNVRTFSMPSFD